MAAIESYPKNIKKEKIYIADATKHLTRKINKPVGAHRDNYQSSK